MTNYDLITATVSLGKTTELITELDGRIADSSSQLEAAKQSLAKFVAEDYKSGTISIWDIILSSASFEDFVNRVVYANKVAERQRKAITTVDDLYGQLLMQKSALEQAKVDQENYIAEQTLRKQQADEAALKAQAYYDQLSEQVRNEIATQQAQIREERKEESKALIREIAEANGVENVDQYVESVMAGYNDEAPAAPLPAIDESQYNAPVDMSDEDTAQLIADVSATYGADVAAQLASGSANYGDMLSRAYEMLGAGYQSSGYNSTGSTSDSSFTCSGLVDYALGLPSHSNSPESLYSEVGNMTSNIDDLQEGDLVFFSYGGRDVGHVGIATGDGYMIDAAPDGGVAIRDINSMADSFVGGGSLE
jgi:cell wall-associated NlpC family hydrolase